MEIYPREGVVKEEKFPNTWKPTHWQVCGGVLESQRQHNLKKNNNNNNNKTQNTCLTTTPSRELAQMLMSTTSKCGLKKEVQVACLG